MPTDNSQKPVVNQSPVTKPSTPSQPPPIDWSKAEEKVNQVRKHIGSFEGRKGHNCFMYDRKYVKPLADRYISGERSEDLFKSIMDLKVEDPTIDKVQDVALPGVIPDKPPTTNLWEDVTKSK